MAAIRVHANTAPPAPKNDSAQGEDTSSASNLSLIRWSIQEIRITTRLARKKIRSVFSSRLTAADPDKIIADPLACFQTESARISSPNVIFPSWHVFVGQRSILSNPISN
jgi:hypothetical protein